MNPMFLSFLKSMQNKSQDAQNPGLWVNGRRMPTNLNEMFPPGQEQDDAEANSPMPGSQAETDNNKRKAAAELAAKVAANKKAQDEKKDDDDEKNDTADNDVFVEAGKVDPRFVQPPRERREKRFPRDDGLSPYSDNSEELGTDNSGKRIADHSYISAKKQREMEASTDPAVLEKVRLRKERKERLAVRKKAEKEKQKKERNYDMFDASRPTDPDRPKKILTPEEQKKRDITSELIKNAGKSNGRPEPRPYIQENTNRLTQDEIARRDLSESNKPKSLSDQKKKPMQENTNRSMFLTHLQSMQTKSQDAQNPGLWVNGNRMPMHENTPGGGTPAGASPEEFAKARAANPFRVRLGKGRPAGAQDLNGDGLVSKAEQELIPVDLRDGDPSANHPDDTDYVHGDN